MALVHGTVTFRQIADALNEVETWFKKEGIELKNSRFLKIKHDMQELALHYEHGTIQHHVKKTEMVEVITAPIDAMAFIDVYEAFGKQSGSPSVPKRKLNKIVGGPYLAMNEDATKSSNESRNTLFELELAALFKKRGLKILGFDDVRFAFGDAVFFMECKRPMSLKSLRKNVSEAANQLSKQMSVEQDRESRGIIAIAVDKIFQTDKGVIRVNTPHELEAALNISLTRLVKSQRDAYWKLIVDPRILSVVFFVNYTTDVKNTGKFSRGVHVLADVLINSDLQFQDRQRMKALEKYLKP